MNPRLHGKGRYLLLAGLVAGVTCWGVGRLSGRERSAPVRDPEVPSATTEVEVDGAVVERVVPAGTRIRVEVLNGTGARGLARRGTRAMRDAGFDVVAAGNAEGPSDSSIVYVRAGRMDWGALAVKALGGARLVARPDSSRDLDLTIVLGARWRPPPEPFDP